jgi:hypothetical protein
MGFVLLLLCSMVATVPDSEELTLSLDTRLAVRLEQSVKTSHSRQGDLVKATLLAPVISHGVVVVPQYAKVVGRVLVSQKRNGQDPSRLVIRFERIEWGRSATSLNAYVLRQLLMRRTVVYGDNSSPCPSMFRSHFQAPRRRGADPPTVSPPNNTYAPCDDRLGVSQRTEPERITQRAESGRVTFISPPLKDMQLLKAVSPRGATALVSRKKNISLERGTMLEILQTAP